jgi:hypothetical protein
MRRRSGLAVSYLFVFVVPPFLVVGGDIFSFDSLTYSFPLFLRYNGFQIE